MRTSSIAPLKLLVFTPSSPPITTSLANPFGFVAVVPVPSSFPSTYIFPVQLFWAPLLTPTTWCHSLSLYVSAEVTTHELSHPKMNFWSFEASHKMKYSPCEPSPFVTIAFELELTCGEGFTQASKVKVALQFIPPCNVPSFPYGLLSY